MIFFHSHRLKRSSPAGTILVATLILFGLVLSFTSVILANSTLAIRRQLSLNGETKQNDLTESARAWLAWRLQGLDAGSMTTPITGPFDSNKTGGSWTLSTEAFDRCAGTQRIQLETRTAPDARPVQQTLLAQTPLYATTTLLIDGSLTLPAGTAVEGWVHANGPIHSLAIHDGLVESSTNDVTVSGDRVTLQKTNADSIPLSPTVPSVTDLTAIAKNAGRLFTATSPVSGYHAHLDGTNVLISRVTKTESRWGFDDREKWTLQEEVIADEEIEQTIKLGTAACEETNIIAVDGPLWIDGMTDRSMTILTVPSDKEKQTNPIIVNGNITTTGSTHIGLIAANDIIIPLNAPNELTIDAAMYTPNGGLLRRHYCAVGIKGQPARCDKSYADSMIRSSLTIFGSLASKHSPQWQWEEADTFVSGYQSATIKQDVSLLDTPPPFFPRHVSPSIVTVLP